MHPWRYGRSPAQLGKKGWDNHRWIVGLKLCWLVNARGEIVAWARGTANVSARRFLPLVAALDGRSVTLADAGFRDPPGTRGARTPPNLKVCRRGAWNERMLIETLLLLGHRVCRAPALYTAQVG